MILLIGKSGMLGSEMAKALSGQLYVAPSSSELDITNRHLLFKYIKSLKPKYVINCAAMTDVDKCEIDVDKSYFINSFGPKNIADACAEVNAKLIHFSTDYVFNGQFPPYIESDKTEALQIYGRHKLEAEQHLAKTNSVICRVQWLYGEGKKNYVTWMADSLSQKQVIDVTAAQVGVPTSCEFIASKILNIKDLNPGIFHIVPSGKASKYDVALEVANYLKVDKNFVKKIEHFPIGWKAKRPGNTVLIGNKMLNELCLRREDWKVGLLKFLGEKWKKQIQGAYSAT